MRAGTHVKEIAFFLVAFTTLAAVLALTAPITGYTNQTGAPIFVTKIPSGYRDWKFISAAHEEDQGLPGRE